MAAIRAVQKLILEPLRRKIQLNETRNFTRFSDKSKLPKSTTSIYGNKSKIRKSSHSSITNLNICSVPYEIPFSSIHTSRTNLILELKSKIRPIQIYPSNHESATKILIDHQQRSSSSLYNKLRSNTFKLQNISLSLNGNKHQFKFHSQSPNSTSFIKDELFDLNKPISTFKMIKTNTSVFANKSDIFVTPITTKYQFKFNNSITTIPSSLTSVLNSIKDDLLDINLARKFFGNSNNINKKRKTTTFNKNENVSHTCIRNENEIIENHLNTTRNIQNSFGAKSIKENQIDDSLVTGVSSISLKPVKDKIGTKQTTMYSGNVMAKPIRSISSTPSRTLLSSESSLIHSKIADIQSENNFQSISKIYTVTKKPYTFRSLRTIVDQIKSGSIKTMTTKKWPRMNIFLGDNDDDNDDFDIVDEFLRKPFTPQKFQPPKSKENYTEKNYTIQKKVFLPGQSK